MSPRRLKPVTVYMEPATQKALKALSIRTRVPAAVYVREALEDVLKKYGEAARKEARR